MNMPEKEEQKPEEKPVPGKGDGKEEKQAIKDNLVVTQHKLRIGGKEIKYTVTAGTMVLKEEPADREKEWEGKVNRRGRSVRLRFRSTEDPVRRLSGCIWESWVHAGWC